MFNIFRKRHWPLFAKLLLFLIPITFFVWLIFSIFGFKYISSRAKVEFVNTNLKVLRGIAQQSIINIHYSDFYQLKRTLNDFFDPKYMDCMALYSQNYKPLAIYPSDLSSEVLGELESLMGPDLKTGESAAVQGRRFYFREDIFDEDQQVIGHIGMIGNTTPIRHAVRSQFLLFVLLGGLLLLVNVVLLTYFTHRATRPFGRLTSALHIVADKKGISELSTATPSSVLGNGVCKEALLFYDTYRRLLRQIEEHQKLEKNMAIQASIGNLTSYIAHDMRNPLHTVNIFMHALPPFDDTDLEEFHGTAERSLSRLTAMTEELLDYSKSNQISPVHIKVGKILNDVVMEMSHRAAENSVKIDLECPADIEADLDVQKIDRVFSNIVVNAIQAISKSEGRIYISARKSGEVFVISFTDNGPGIAEEHIPHLFDSSFTYGKRRGTGLGLSYCQKVVEAHGGSINVESYLGKGSIFTIMLPLRQKKMKGVFEQTPTIEMTAEKKPRPRNVLVVDDDPGIRVHWRTLLKKFSVQSWEADSLEDLLSQNIDYSNIDLAIVDYQFEGSKWNGFDVLSHLKNQKIDNLYLCTGFYQDDEIRYRAHQFGVQDILPKPFTEETLSRIL